jgi:hypothetical protein
MSKAINCESYIIEKALFYAAHFIDDLPLDRGGWADRAAMITLLRMKLGDTFMERAEIHGSMLERATGRPFEIEGY